MLTISIDSLLAQTFTDLEVVVVVDGDLCDESERYLAAAQLDDPRLVVLRPGRVGRARALNIGLDAAQAPLVAIQDADDASHPRRLEIEVAAFRSMPELALLGTGFKISSGLTDTASWSLPDGQPKVRLVGRALLRSNPVVHSSVLARRSVLEMVGGYDESRTAQFDYDLLLRVSSAGLVIGLCDSTLVLHRRHPGQYFERLGPIRRALGSYQLQTSYISTLEGPERLGYRAIAAGRLAYQVARSVANRFRS